MLTLLASSDIELITRWEESVFSLSASVTVNSFKQTKDKIGKVKPDLLLLDYNLLMQDQQTKMLDIAIASPNTKILLFSPKLSDKEEWQLFRNGIKGCCTIDMKPEQITYAIKAILKGELWIRRSLTSFMLDELVEISMEKERIETAIHDLLTNLTKREYEIAMLVGNGESNKRIANRLDITERTVKAHLTEIFRKLQITDRIKLALMMKETVTSLKPHQTNHIFNDTSYYA
ncbi:MAG: response regulator transcription factor [Nitrosomonas sp.]|nr:response regulator transcription factor [Nitrosomonas sp.]